MRVGGEPGGDLVGVGDVAVHAQGQGLDALQDQEGVEGREGRAHVAQADRLVADGEREIAEGLEEAQAVIGLGRLGQQRELAVGPVEPAALDDRAADRVALAAQIFGHGVDDDVGPPLAAAGRGRGWAGCCRRPAAGRGRGRWRRSPRCRRRCRRGWRRSRRTAPGSARRCARRSSAARAGRRSGPPSRTAGRCGSSARSSRHRAWSSTTTLLPGRSRLRKVRNWAAWPEAVQQAAVPPSSAAIRDSSTETVGLVRRRVDVAELLQVEQRRGMVDVVEHVGGGLVDRDRAGAGGRDRARHRHEPPGSRSRRCARSCRLALPALLRRCS